MTVEEKNIIEEYYYQKISRDEFLKRYPYALDNNYIYNAVKTAYKNKNSDELELSLSLIIFNVGAVNSKEFITLLCELLKEKWHQEHENIVLILQNIKSVDSIDTLYSTTLIQLDYLSYDDTYALARKCIHALGDINTEYSKEKLELLTHSDIPIIKEKAEKQLYYYKH